MLPAGKSLRTLREKLGLTMRDIETSSARMAEKYQNEEFSVPPSRLSDIETKGVLPNIFRLYTLSVIYRRDFRELLGWYGIDLNNTAADLGMIAPPRSHMSEALAGLASVQVPIRLDPAFNEQRTANLGRMVEQWGLVPLSYLAQFAHPRFHHVPDSSSGQLRTSRRGKKQGDRGRMEIGVRAADLLRGNPKWTHLLLVQHAEG
jgi:transcriptional regulator with XRE-family HTH domain